MPEFFGLDIGSNLLKAVELEAVKDDYKLVTYGSSPTPSGAVLSESEIDQQELTKSIIRLVKEHKIKSRRVVTAFPESLIFTRVIEIPWLRDKELANAIQWEAEQYIPMPLSEVKFSWMKLDKPTEKKGKEGEKMKILLVAAPNSLVQRYLHIVRQAGLEPVAFETETVAIVRSLTRGVYGSGPTTLLMSIGASTTDLTIVDQGVIQFTRSIGTGGVALTRVISQELGFDMNQAEEYKRAYGLIETQLEGRIMKVIKPVFDVIVSEVERSILSFQTHNPSQVVKRVVLTGGSAQLPGMVVYLAQSLGVEVQIGNPWEKVRLPENRRDEFGRIENQVNYAVAVGLAMKEV